MVEVQNYILQTDMYHDILVIYNFFKKLTNVCYANTNTLQGCMLSPIFILTFGGLDPSDKPL